MTVHPDTLRTHPLMVRRGRIRSSERPPDARPSADPPTGEGEPAPPGPSRGDRPSPRDTSASARATRSADDRRSALFERQRPGDLAGQLSRLGEQSHLMRAGQGRRERAAVGRLEPERPPEGARPAGEEPGPTGSRCGGVGEGVAGEGAPVPRRSGATATLRISAWRPSPLASQPVLPTTRPSTSRSSQSRTARDSRPASVRSASRRNRRRSPASPGCTRSRATAPMLPDPPACAWKRPAAALLRCTSRDVGAAGQSVGSSRE